MRKLVYVPEVFMVPYVVEGETLEEIKKNASEGKNSYEMIGMYFHRSLACDMPDLIVVEEFDYEFTEKLSDEELENIEDFFANTK